MKLPAIPFLTKSVSVDFFLSLIFESDKVSAILFQEQERSLTILSTHSAKIELEEASVEDLVVAADNVVSRVEMSLPENANLEKTIFAVPHSWIEEAKIKPERLNQLKKVSQELALTPMGFIVSIEAIVAYLQKKEGAPISGIFVELAEKIVTVYVVRSGNIIEVKQGELAETVEKTVEKLLGRITKLDVLPSKIILLHTKESEAVSQKFLSHHWTKELPFMHLPQVAILERGVENEAIISGVASQLNVSVKGDTIPEPVEPTDEEDFEDSGVTQSEDGFGFVQDEDIAQASKKEEPEVSKEEELSFTEDDHPEPIVRHHGIEQTNTEPQAEETYEEDEPEVSRKSSNKLPVGAIGAALASFFTPNTMSKIPKMIGGTRNLLFVVAGLIAIGAFIYAYYAYLLKAEIVVFTDQKAVTEDALGISLTTNGESSFSDKTIRISTVEQEVSGEEQQETTGQKDTGQKATGTVTIFNKTESSKKLEKGTTITSSNKLDFTLDEDVNIASTSSFSTSFSSGKAKVTAANFGKEYNLPSQTNFTVKGVSSSDIFGKNDSAFSGGTKEEIQVVAKKDLTNLENTITKRLFEKAKEQAEKDLSDNDGLVPSYLSFDFSEKKFDKKEDEKAKSVKLDATVVYTLGIYRKDELEKFISSSDEFDVPEDFKLSDSESSISISDIKQKGDDVTAKLSFNAVFKPQLDIKNIPQSVSGKNEKEALEKLKGMSGIADATILFPFKLPLLPVILPLRPENIKVELKTQ